MGQTNASGPRERSEREARETSEAEGDGERRVAWEKLLAWKLPLPPPPPPPPPPLPLGSAPELLLPLGVARPLELPRTRLLRRAGWEGRGDAMVRGGYPEGKRCLWSWFVVSRRGGWR